MNLSHAAGRIAVHVATISTGLFTGLLWCFTVAIDPAERRLEAARYAQWRQYLIQDLDRGILPVLVLSALAPVVALVLLRRHGERRAFTWVAIAFTLYAIFVMAYTVVLNVPINNRMLAWDAAAPPADWAAERDRWNLLNVIRTPVAIASFACYVYAVQLLGRSGPPTPAAPARRSAAPAR